MAFAIMSPSESTENLVVSAPPTLERTRKIILSDASVLASIERVTILSFVVVPLEFVIVKTLSAADAKSIVVEVSL